MSDRYSYQLALPPRQVPWPVRNQLLWGGFANQFGWLFFGFGLIFFWIFGLNADLSALSFTPGKIKTVDGRVIAVEDTNASENDTPIYANHYAYRIERWEREYQGVSYSLGRRFEPGQTVTVEYLRSDPTNSRIAGTRQGWFSPWVLLIVLPFPLIGLGFIVFGLRNGLKANRLLANGKVGLGTLKSMVPTNTRVNNQTVYKLTFEFTADDGRYCEVVAKTHLTSRLRDDDQERLLYDPDNPSYAVMLDNLPGKPDIDELGQIRPASPGSGWLVLVLPLLALLGHGTVFLWVTLL